MYAGIEFEPITGPGKPAVNDGAASVASYHSDASTAEAAGDLYQIEELVPSALMMTPSASLENDDAQYEPTMSPSAFQAALAAGIFAAQRQPLPADTQLAKPVSLVLTPLRDARVEVALTCTDEAAPLQPAFDSQQNVSSAVAAVPDKLAAVPALAQYDLESSSPATAQQDAETSAFTLLDAGIAEVQSPAAVMPAAAETSSQQADLSVPTSLQDVPSVPSIDVISQDAQVVLDQVAAESPRAAASATAEPQESATEQPAAASSASGQQTVAGAKPDQLLGHPNTDRPTENSSPKLQGRTDPSMSGRIVLPHCSKRYAEVISRSCCPSTGLLTYDADQVATAWTCMHGETLDTTCHQLHFRHDGVL